MTGTMTPTETSILWGRTGGRCSNPTCTSRVDQYRTRRIGNAGERAHVKGKKANAARHDPAQTESQRRSIQNHILLCLTCHKMIDSCPSDFPVALLLDWKEKHETRVAKLLDVGLRAIPTRIVRMNARFGQGDGRIIPASDQDMQNAVLALGRWLPEQSVVDINVDTVRRDHELSYWGNVEDEVTRQFDRHFQQVGGQAKAEHLSVFASGPIPLLMLLGKLLGDTRSIHVFDRHRSEQSWMWPVGDFPPLQVSTSVPEEAIGREGILVLGVSGVPDLAGMASVLGGRALPTFRVDVPNAAPGVVRSMQQLHELRGAFHAVMEHARRQLGHDGILHVFPAMGLSSAVAFGQTILPKVGPQVVVYDHSQASGGWVRTLSW